MSVTLRNARSRQVIATGVEVALTRSARRQGLLQRDALDPASALVLAPCFAVHTAFMRFAIDVIFVDRAGHVRRVVRRLAPWRLATSLSAYATIELAAGALEAHDVMVGDRLYLEKRLGEDAGEAPPRSAEERRVGSASPGQCRPAPLPTPPRTERVAGTPARGAPITPPWFPLRAASAPRP